MVLKIPTAQKLLVVKSIKLLPSLQLAITFRARKTLDVKHPDSVGRFQDHIIRGDVFLAGSARTSLTPGRKLGVKGLCGFVVLSVRGLGFYILGLRLKD